MYFLGQPRRKVAPSFDCRRDIPGSLGLINGVSLELYPLNDY